MGNTNSSNSGDEGNSINWGKVAAVGAAAAGTAVAVGVGIASLKESLDEDGQVDKHDRNRESLPDPGYVRNSSITSDERNSIDWGKVAAAAGAAVAVGVGIASLKKSLNEDGQVDKRDLNSECLPDTGYVLGPSEQIALPLSEYETTVIGSEYQRVSDKFFDSVSKHNHRIVVITKVDNPTIEYWFKEKCHELAERRSIEIKELFHGTRIKNVPKICANNFDLNKGKHEGVFFTEYSSYATKFSGETNTKAVFLVDVLIGKCCQGPENGGKPLDGSDTRLSNTESTYVKYEENTFIPRYVIYYKKY